MTAQANWTNLLFSFFSSSRRYSPKALEQSIEFIRDTIAMRDDANGTTGTSPTGEKCHRGSKNTKNIVGIIGPGSSAVTIQVQNLLQLFNIPQIGYSATSRELSRKDFYKYFLRVVPSDEFQSKLMVDVLLKLNWSYVITVNSEGEYFERFLAVVFRRMPAEAKRVTFFARFFLSFLSCFGFPRGVCLFVCFFGRGL